MPSPPSSQIFLCLSFIIFLDTTMSEKYEAGKYATISCLAPSNRDFRALSFYKGTSSLFTIRIVNDTLSNTLEVYGTYNDFTWILNQDGRETYPCTNANSERSDIRGCRGPESTDTKIYLSDGEYDMASLSIDSNYKSRIWLSGTILNATIIVTDLVKEDEGCYTCRWEEFRVPGLYRGPDHCLDIAMSERYEAGKSATISCLAPSNRDFRELSLYKGTLSLYTIWITIGTLSNTLEVSGTYNNFTWILNQDGRKPYPCTNANSEGSATLGCRGAEGKDTEIYLSVGEYYMASLYVDCNYRSRIRLSGTILNATIILSDLVKEDEGCYSCRWDDFTLINNPRLFRGAENCFDIENPSESSKGNPPDNSTTRHIGIGTLSGLIGLLIGLVIGCLIFLQRRRKIRELNYHMSTSPVEEL